MGSGAMLQVATGGISLKVPGDRLADARVILSRNGGQFQQVMISSMKTVTTGQGSMSNRALTRCWRIMKMIVWFMLTPSLIGFAVGILALIVMLLRRFMGLFRM